MTSTEEFINTIISLTDCSNEQIEKVLSFSQFKDIPKGGTYIREGEIPKSFAFVAKGLFRYFYTHKNGNELTKGFFPERTFITSYSALLENRESYFTIEALEDSTILVIEYRKWKEVAQNETCWLNFLLRLVEKGYCTKEAREREFLLFDAQERYLSFLKRHPGLEKRIKQHHVASYLGITPVSLSRIKKKMEFY